MRFSILTVFIALFVTSIIFLSLIIYMRFSQSISHAAFQFMKQTSDSLYEKIDTEIKEISTGIQLFSNLVSSGVININGDKELIEYMRNFLSVMSNNFPSLQSIYFADETGSFYMAGKTADGGIETEIINRKQFPSKRTIIYSNSQGKAINTIQSNDLSYDPRVRLWYVLAKQQKTIIWTDVYPYRLKGYLGITAALPIYTERGEIKGIIAFNLRLDYIRHFIEHLQISPNGIIYIVNLKGSVIAFPHLSQYKSRHLINIHDIKVPWLIASFEEYKRNQQSNFKFRYGGENYLAIYLLVPQLEGWMIGMVAPERDFISELLKTNGLGLLLSLMILLLGIILMSRLVNKIVTPLKKVVEETEKIKNFELNTDPPLQSRIKEIHTLSEAIFKMKQGLRSFKKYVPANLVRKLIESGHDVFIGGEKTQLAIFFSDIDNFTSISEEMDPDKLMKYICEYFNEISPIIENEGGTIDKYIGDSVMAFWGAPLPVDKPCHLAAQAALRIIKRVSELNQQWIKENNPPFNTRIGLHFGEAIIGNLGSKERLNYTAVGDVINTTSRLESINKFYGTRIIVSETVYKEIKDDFALRLIDSITLKGRIHATYIYELMAKNKDELQFNLDEYRDTFAAAFAAYQKLQLDDALSYFIACLNIYPDDSVSRIFIDRCEYLQKNPTAPEWSGIWHMDEK